jgi:hypothetical protein
VIQELIQHEIQDETDNRKNSELGEEEEGDSIISFSGRTGGKRHTSDGWEEEGKGDDLHIELDDFSLQDDDSPLV